MNLLVTGGAGFIGSNVIYDCIDRPEIRRLVNLDCLTYAGHLENLARVASHDELGPEALVAVEGIRADRDHRLPQ